MRYFSTFSGIGGFELGIQRACENLSDTKGLPETPSCIGYSEIDKYAISIYQKHFPNHKNYGDITKINQYTLPDFEMLVGGFPCQSFSIIGKRGGFEDTRGTMFFEIARIVRQKLPRLLLLENVKGLLSHDKGSTFNTIVATLDELGYDLQWQVLNSKNHGVPQNRERVFIIGHLRGTPRPKVFPLIGTADEDTEDVASTALDANYWKGIDNHGQRTAIVHNIYGGFKEKKPRVFTKESPTIRTSAGGGHLPSVLKDAKVRRLTPVECERLQGFPDGWTEAGLYECGKCEACYDNHQPPCINPQHGKTSDTQRYKCIGNAVTVNVIEDIMTEVFHSLSKRQT